MFKSRQKLKLLDWLIIASFLATALIIFLNWGQKPNLGQQQVLVRVVVKDDQAENLLAAMQNLPQKVFFNGTKDAVSQLAYEVLRDDKDQFVGIIIDLVGPGDITNFERASFNGQRILINQKAEIRAGYFVQGKIQSYQEYVPETN